MASHHKPKSFIRPILALQRLIHPELSLTLDAKLLLDDVIDELFLHLMQEVDKVLTKNRSATVSTKAVRKAVREFFPSKLARTSNDFAASAVAKYFAHKAKHSDQIERNSTKAGLVFPVSLVGKALHAKKYRAGPPGAIYVAAVLEYVCAEILQSAGHIANGERHKRITYEDVREAILADHDVKAILQ